MRSYLLFLILITTLSFFRFLSKLTLSHRILLIMSGFMIKQTFQKLIILYSMQLYFLLSVRIQDKFRKSETVPEIPRELEPMWVQQPYHPSNDHITIQLAKQGLLRKTCCAKRNTFGYWAFGVQHSLRGTSKQHVQNLLGEERGLNVPMWDPPLHSTFIQCIYLFIIISWIL